MTLVAYASRTGTQVNLALLRKAGWRLMVSAQGVLRTEGFPYALDNGAWTTFQRSESFDERRFLRAVDQLGEGADFVVVPDIVCGGLRSLEFSLSWLPRLDGLPRLSLPVQNGMEPRHVKDFLGRRIGIFVGGDDAWKESSMFTWADLGRSLGAHVHVGRVNTVRRIRICGLAGVDSFDGSGVSRYAIKNIGRLDSARRQLSIPFHAAQQHEPTPERQGGACA